MENSLTIDEISPELINIIKKICKPQTYRTESELIYENHIPHAGFLLLDGEIKCLKKKKVFRSINECSLFGVKELMNNSPIKFTVKICPNSKVCILDRSSVKEIELALQNNKLPYSITS